MGADNNIKGTVVTGVIGEDVHIVGIRIIEQALNDNGFKVSSMGAQVSQEEFINAALETNADAIFISSFSGHAEILVRSFRDKCTEAGLNDIILYIGGSLLLREEQWEEVEKKFKDLGFNRVYPPGTSPTRAIEDLKKDILLRREKGD
ncbi:MAG TPA: methylaspartate mutase subunit S [Firmicutes bacterium]|nr:methylaspartate mutase subunit S [Bacillota bacterium]